MGLALDRRLGAAAAARLEAHLSACEGCRAERSALARSWARLEVLAAGPAPREDWAAIQARIAARVERRPWLRWALPVRRAVATAALAALALAGALAGDAMSHAAFGPKRAPTSLEAVAIAEGFGVMPFGGPSTALLLAGQHGGRP